jgi:hypothetical protein
MVLGEAAGPRAKGKTLEPIHHNRHVFRCMQPEPRKRKRPMVVAHTSVPKLVARLASRVVRARLLTLAVSSEVKHTVSARRPLRHGSAGAPARGVRPFVSCDIAARSGRSALHVSRV